MPGRAERLGDPDRDRATPIRCSRGTRSALATCAVMMLIALAALVGAPPPASAQDCTTSPCTGSSVLAPYRGATWLIWDFRDSSRLDAAYSGSVASFGYNGSLGYVAKTNFYDSSELNAKVATAINGGEQRFYGQSVLNALAASSINGGQQYFYDTSALNAEVANAISGGYQSFSGNSALNAEVANAVGGGSQAFSSSSALNALAANAVSGGQQSFDGGSTLNALAADAVSGGRQSFGGNSTLNAGAANAISGGNQSFNYDSALNAQVAYAISGGDQYFTDESVLNATAANAVSGGSQRFYTGELNALAPDAVSGGTQTFSYRAYLNAEAANAVSGGVQTFLGYSALNASVANAVNGGVQNFTEYGALNATAANAVSGGTQNFYNRITGFNSVLNADVANAISGGTQNFSGYSALNASSPSAISGGKQNFSDRAILNAQATHAVNGGIQTFLGNSTLDASAANAVNNGSQNFRGNSTLNAEVANAVGGLSRQSFEEKSALNAQVTDAVSGGTRFFSQSAALNALATGAVSGGVVNLSQNSTIQIRATNALTNDVAVNFGFQNGGIGGTLVLNGYSTTVGSINSSVAGAGRIVNNGAANAILTIGGAADSFFSGDIADSDNGATAALGLTKTGTGLLVLSGFNTYTGGTNVLAGTLQATSNSLQGQVLNEGTVIFDQNFNGTFGGVMSGTGNLVKNGSGKLTLIATQTFTGATDINAGNLNVNGSLASSLIVNVNAGGTLSGGGVLGKVNVNGGIVSPGNSVGTLHVDGNFAMATDSTYRVELNGKRSDLIVVTGAADIQSSTFEIAHDTNTASPPVLPGKTYTILTSVNGLTVQSPEVAIADFPFLSFKLSEDGYNGYLTTSRSAERFSDYAATANEKAVANVLDAAVFDDPLWQQIVGATEDQARDAFDNLSNASIHASAVGVLSAQSQYLRDAINDRMRQGFSFGPAMPGAGLMLSYGPQTVASPFDAAQPAGFAGPVYAMWGEALGGWGALEGDGNAAATDYSLGGVITGLDATFDERWRVGVAAGYSQTSFDSPGTASSGSSDNYHAALYGGGQLGDWGVRAGASLTWSDIATQRGVLVVNLSDIAQGDGDALTTQLFGEVGHRFALDRIVIEPFANLAYVRVDSNFSDTGVAGVSGEAGIDTTYTTLGMRGATALSDEWTVRGMLGWRHAFGDVVPQSTLGFLSGGPQFSLAGSPIAQDTLVAEAGLDLTLTPAMLLGLSWSGQFADDAHDNAVNANFTVRF